MSDRDAWLEERRKGLGGSDAAVVMGASPWRSRYQLWLDKTGLGEPDQDNERMEWGRRLEPLIAQTYAEKTGRTLRPAQQLVRHPRITCMLGTPDGFIVDPKRGDGVLEIKTTGAVRGDDWLEEPPLQHQIQGQHYLAVTGLAWVSFAVLIGGQKFAWCDVERNDKFISVLEEECQAFWKLVEAGTPPPVDGSESTAKALKAMFPKENREKIVTLPDEAAAWTDEIEAAKLAIREGEKRKMAAENALKAAIGDAAVGLVKDRGTWSYYTVEKKPHEVKASAYRQLRWKEIR